MEKENQKFKYQKLAYKLERNYIARRDNISILIQNGQHCLCQKNGTD